MKKLALSTFFFALTFTLTAQISSRQIDSVSEKVLKAFNVPGIAVAVVKDGKVIHQKGYGVTSLKTGEKVNEHTRFAIASNSKAFTSAALAILIDQGKLKWTTLVRDIIPEFKLYAPFVTENFLIEDLLTHRSGLGLGAGDLMFWPGRPKFSKADIIHNLRYLKPVSQFRTKYDYDNLLYMVAGEVVERIAGMSWEAFVEKNIFSPLGMNESAGAYERLKSMDNIIDPHVPINGVVQTVARELNGNLNAAGGIYSSVYDMSKWAITQLNYGKYGANNQLFSPARQAEMWNIHTVTQPNPSGPYKTNFSGYGLGWGLSDENGHKVATHTGGLLGIVTQVTLIPDLKLGIIVFTNQQSGAAFYTVTNTIKDAYYGVEKRDWIQIYQNRLKASEKNAKEITDKIENEIKAASAGVQPETSKFAGNYIDPWFGKITISQKGNQLYFQAEKSPKLHGPMYYYKGNNFVVRWEDRSLDADAFVNFGLDFEGRPDKITMEAISPLTDFSFDFQDLNFSRIK
ncbi:MAG: serine hydrolase [Chitinophagaceae bacterium]|nr:serine hydrolase [Chitinophagaceae bacterium]